MTISQQLPPSSSGQAPTSEILIEPETVGVSSARLERLRKKFHAYVDEQKLSGVSMLVTRCGKAILHDLYGYQDIENRIPITDDTLFRLYSMTKPLTSLLLIVLFEEGRFLMFDPVADYIPEFKDVKVLKGVENGKVLLETPRRQMMIYDLFAHSSGLGNFHLLPPEVGLQRASVLDVKKTIGEGVRNLAKIPLLFHPGEGFAYGHSHDVLGHLAEIITGDRLDKVMREKLLDPLGMDDTHFIVPAHRIKHLAQVYGMQPGKGLLNVTASVPPSGDYINPEAIMFSGGGGLVSSTADVMKVTHMLLNGGVLNGVELFSPFTVNYMLQDHMPRAVKSMYETYGNTDILFKRVMGGLRMSLFFATVADVQERASLDAKGSFTYGGLANTLSFGDPGTGLAGTLMVQDVSTPLNLRMTNEFKLLCYQAIRCLDRPT